MLPDLTSEEKTFVGYEAHISRLTVCWPTPIRICHCREALDGETMNVARLRQTWRTVLGFPSSVRVTVAPKRSEGALLG